MIVLAAIDKVSACLGLLSPYVFLCSLGGVPGLNFLAAYLGEPVQWVCKADGEKLVRLKFVSLKRARPPPPNAPLSWNCGVLGP